MDIDYRIELKYLDTHRGSERDCQIYIFSLSLLKLSLSLSKISLSLSVSEFRGLCSGDSIESAIFSISHCSSGIPRLLLSICVFSQNIMFQIFKVRNIYIKYSFRKHVGIKYERNKSLYFFFFSHFLCFYSGFFQVSELIGWLIFFC